METTLPKTTSIPIPKLWLVRFSTKDRVLFAKRLAFLTHAGVSLLESITIIRNQTTNTRKRLIYEAIIKDLAAGQFLSTSLIKYERLFGALTINLIRTGETAGILAGNVSYLADELTKRQQLQSKVRSALIYPLFITGTTFTITGMLVVYIFPKILPVFSSLNITLPFTTRLLLGVSYFLQDYGLVLILGLLLCSTAFVVIRKNYPPLHYATDWLVLKIPIVGNIARSYNCANFCRTLGLNLHSGITVSEGVIITSSVTGNLLYKQAYSEFTRQILSGQKLSTTMQQYPLLFPYLLPQLLYIGETTGSLSASLGYLSGLYESEVDESTRNLSTLVEPVLLIIMGLIVGLVAISVITPIYELTHMLGSHR